MLISAARIVTGGAGSPGTQPMLAPGHLTCADGKIVSVGAGQPPHGKADVHLHEGFLVPGFVDLQVNGYFGVEMASADDDGWMTVVRRLPETGTTAFLPTFITSPLGEMVAAVRRAAGRRGESTGSAGGARVLGVHLEGPFISPKRPGAHNPAWMLTPEPGSIETLLDAGAGVIRLVTIAPELDGGIAAVKQFAGSGAVVSVGHSDATAHQVSAAAMAGATMVTHLFNAQRPMHHREPGVVGQALADTRLTSSLIADLHHVTGQVAAIAFVAAPGRMCLITDAAACAGMPPGQYVLGGQPIDLTEGDGTPPLRSDGTIAGSALRMDSAVANMVATGVSLGDAVAAATRIPANLIGRPDLGRLIPGAAADFVWLSENLRTTATWVGGKQVYGPHFG